MNQKICGYDLDNQQKAIVEDESNHLLVVAGAGSGKTLTILGKVYYLVKVKNISPNEIICISFTKASSDSLREKIKNEFNFEIPVYTFHKLALNILKEDHNYTIADPSTLDYIIDEFFKTKILNYPEIMSLTLKYFSLNNKEEYIKNYEKGDNKIILLQRLISTFIHLFKCNNYELNDFIKFSKKIKKSFSYKKEKIILTFILNCYLEYEEYLKQNNEIDFDDMLIRATEKIQKEGYREKVQYVMIDEYQDTSLVKFNLVKEILNFTNAKLMVVGDDFQSIYRFTGCDLSLFLNFNSYFKDSKVMRIENTYRNSQELIQVAGKFVMKNKAQLKKNLKSSKRIDKPIVFVNYVNLKQQFLELIKKIYKETQKPILVLGRNNKDIHSILDYRYFKVKENEIIYKLDDNIKITYLTVHKSKGLEEENVILINMKDELLGFPSQIKNNKILRLVSKSSTKYPYDEERRLFYVALTRTKNKIYLLIPNKNQSIFVKELWKNYKKLIEKI